MYQLVIVEDEALTREGLRHHFPWGELGFEVAEAFPNGEEALAFIREHPCDAVITDIMMGQMNGLELAAEIKSFSPPDEDRHPDRLQRLLLHPAGHPQSGVRIPGQAHR